ncbi:MAG: 4-hydroxy-3-methylbut-2-enyl diphosphate reductase [Fibrobacteria bacterium]|nr:4-hydroxy-3-methylbut-2-enyl diphosphate reductase [Fibrobacteria bacterium]
MTKRILLAAPRGFCAGVERAIEIVERAIEKFGPPVYVRHEIVHNRHVVQGLRDQGAVFIDELEEAPSGSNVIFSAHGVPESVFSAAAERGLNVIDAACPLVKKVHFAVKRHATQQRLVVLIGHKGHPEVVGTMGQLPEGSVILVGTPEEARTVSLPEGRQFAYTTQTTLSVDETREIIEALRERIPEISGPAKGDLCYATTNRQSAVRGMAPEVDVLLVIGSRSSSNTSRLRELGEKLGIASYLLDQADEADPAWFAEATTIGITSGASAPESLVQGLVERIQQLHPGSVVDTWAGIAENVHFPLPRELA